MSAAFVCQKDLSVIGIDNIPLGDYLPRRLTTIAQPLEELANATAELMLQRLDKKAETTPPQSRKFKAKLLIKGTTAESPKL